MTVTHRVSKSEYELGSLKTGGLTCFQQFDPEGLTIGDKGFSLLSTIPHVEEIHSNWFDYNKVFHVTAAQVGAEVLFTSDAEDPDKNGSLKFDIEENEDEWEFTYRYLEDIDVFPSDFKGCNRGEIDEFEASW